MILMLLALALAASPEPDPSPEPPAEAPEAPAPEVASPEELIVDAVNRLLTRDLDGASLLLDRATVRLPDDDAPRRRRLETEIAYHRGTIAVAREDRAAALDLYRSILTRWPDSHRDADARVRVAEVLAATGDPAGALRALGELPPARALSPSDARRVAILREIWRLDAAPGRSDRKLRRLVDAAPTDPERFYVARGVARLARYAVDEAASVRLDGSERRSARGVNRRIEALKRAETQVERVLALREPEWIFEGVLAMAEGFERFGDDILTAPPPGRLTEEQTAIYLAGIAEQVDALWLRGLRYADEGRQAAARLEWSGRRVDALERLHAELERKLDAR
jgi:tetratricopeptide (TPR) repeat protein